MRDLVVHTPVHRAAFWLITILVIGTLPVFRLLGAPEVESRSTYALLLGSWVLSASYLGYRNVVTVIGHDTLKITQGIGLLRSTKSIPFASIERIELTEYRNLLVAHLVSGNRVVLAHSGSTTTGDLPDMKFGPGVPGGPRRTLSRIKLAIETRCGNLSATKPLAVQS